MADNISSPETGMQKTAAKLYNLGKTPEQIAAEARLKQEAEAQAAAESALKIQQQRDQVSSISSLPGLSSKITEVKEQAEQTRSTQIENQKATIRQALTAADASTKAIPSNPEDAGQKVIDSRAQAIAAELLRMRRANEKHFKEKISKIVQGDNPPDVKIDAIEGNKREFGLTPNIVSSSADSEKNAA
ncbi:MAG TPA: hypothetical protein VMR41_01380 [Patescibacteria group bacterium]|nr:hypothetical protein [Patescibacteria group bacterium]